MCIAVAVPAGTACPSLETLHACWTNNDDGAGMAWNHNGKVIIKKGFMTWESFKAAFEKYSKEYDFTKAGVLLHFRISTCAGVNPQNTHPFPISNDTAMLQKPESVSDYAVVHNGIISLTSSTATAEKTTSDTLVFVRDYIWNIAQNRGWFRRESNIDLIYRLAGSKVAILNRFGEIIHTPGFTEDNGVWYSNDTYKNTRVRYSHSYGNYGCYYGNRNYNYDYDYDDYYGSGYRDYRGYNSNNGYSQYHTVPLMKCAPGDTICGDSVDDVCNSYNDVNFAISKEGFLYYMYKEEGTSSVSLEFIGVGAFYDKTNKERQFVANYWPREEQFLGDEYPSKILCEDDDDDITIYDDADYSKKKEMESVRPENNAGQKNESAQQIEVVKTEADGIKS